MGAAPLIDRIETERESMCSHSVVSLSAPFGTYRSDVEVLFDDPLMEALIATRPLKRLAGIGFLGAIDYVRHGSGRSPYLRRHNRLEHSIGVARLADIYARGAELPSDRRLVLLAAALLHDVGHGPLSHSLEPVFRSEFGIDHHLMTRRILKGDTRLGSEVPDILGDAGIDIDEVLALIDGEHDGDVGFLFSGQINLDTLEGITRCRAFAAPRPAFRSAESVVRKWAIGNSLPKEEFDAFWQLKHDIYNLLIGASQSVALDAIAQAYMKENLHKFSPEDFLLTEQRFKYKFRSVLKFLTSASKSMKKFSEKIPFSFMEQQITIKRRSFLVCEDVDLIGHTDIDNRYRQTKCVQNKALHELIL